MKNRRKTNAEDLGVIGIACGWFGLIALLIGLFFYPMAWIGLFLFVASILLVILAILTRNRLN